KQTIAPLITDVADGASIGANATILPGIRIGKGAMVGAGAVVIRDVPAHAVVVGNPAQITCYTNTERHPGLSTPQAVGDEPVHPLRVKTARLYTLPLIRDQRGALSFGELDSPLPFVPKRYFVVFDVPTPEVRGQHAHITLHQFLVCLRGSCEIVLDDG